MSSHTPQLNLTFRRLFLALFVVTGVLSIGLALPATSVAAESDRVAEDSESCDDPCPCDSPDDDDCPEGCTACGCCSSMAPVVSFSRVIVDTAVSTPRGDLPAWFSAGQEGVHRSIFKPPRPLMA